MKNTPFVLAVPLVIAMLNGCGADPVQQAYDDCMAQVQAGTAEAEAGVGKATMKEMIEGIEQMAESSCGLILSTCEADREGAMCHSMISQFDDSE